MSFSYYNKGDVTLLPSSSKGVSQSGEYIRIDRNYSFSIPTPIETKDAYYSFFYSKDYKYADPWFSFTLKNKEFRVNATTFNSLFTDKHTDLGTGVRVFCHFHIQDDGLLVEITIAGAKYSTVDTSVKSLPMSVTFGNDYSGGALVKDIFISDTEIPPYAEYTHLTINDITNWEKGTDGNYLLTDVDKEGIIQLDNEQLTKLKQTSDIMSCYLCCQLEKKGSKLKTLQFSVGDKVGTYEIPVGTSTCYIPLTFNSPSDMQNVKVVIKG